MADEDQITKEEKQEDVEAGQPGQKPQDTDKKTSKSGILPWIIMFFFVVLCCGAGFTLGRFFAASRTSEPAENPQEGQTAQVEYLKADGSATETQKTWYYDLEPVVSNLNEPGVTRYVRASLTLEISSEVDSKKGQAFIKERSPLLKNWLAIYLASLSLENIRGNRNLKRIQSQLLEAFNEQLFPDSKPHIKQVLFKEFAVQ